jgi:hypothetical protein
VCADAFLHATNFEEIMTAFRELPRTIDADSLLDGAFAPSLTTKEIETLQAEYAQLVAADLPTCTGLAGKGFKAHQQAEEARLKARRR